MFKHNISVVVPSFDGCDKLKILVHALNAQTRLPEEVIIVLDGSQDGSLEWLNFISHSNQIRYHLKLICQDNQGRGASKHIGAMNAKGNLIIFCDDDMIPESGWIEAHEYAHHYAEVVSGPIELCRHPNGSHEFFQYFSLLTYNWNIEHAQEGNFFFSAANVSFKSSVYYSTGGFDCSLRDNEDREYAIRLHKLGVQVRHYPNCKSFTRCYLNFQEYAARLRDYKTASKALKSFTTAREKARDKNIWKMLRICLQKVKSLPLLHWFLAWLIDHSVFILLPQYARFKLYTIMLF